MKANGHPEPDRDGTGNGVPGQGFDSDGGKGVLVDPHHARADMRLIEMAARRKWPVSKRMRKISCERLEKIVEAEKTEDYLAVAAIRTAATLDSINVKREAAAAGQAMPSVHLHQHNEQIVVYVPDNGRDARVIENSSNGNGHSSH